MLIACASDAHGAREAEQAMVQSLPRVDALCYLGDCEEDAMRLRCLLAERQPEAAFHAVRGNCDPFSPLPDTLELTFGPIKALLTHGHLFRVKLTVGLLAETAHQRGCALALFGHTHRPLSQAQGGIWLVNPGSLMKGNWALVEIDETGAIRAQMQTLA